MGLTLSNVLTTVDGARRKTVYTATFDSSYPTGGESLTAADLGFGVGVDYANVQIKAIGGTVNVTNVFYDIPNAKLIAYDETPAEVTDTATLATLVVQVEAWGH